MRSQLLRVEVLECTIGRADGSTWWMAMLVLITDPKQIEWACKHEHPSRLGAETCARAELEKRGLWRVV